MTRKPLILGIGGTIRAGSSTEKALVCALSRAEALGAETRLLGGAFLGGLPIFDPRPGSRCNASAGTPAWCIKRTAAAAMSGVRSAGFDSTVLPAASAPGPG